MYGQPEISRPKSVKNLLRDKYSVSGIYLKILPEKLEQTEQQEPRRMYQQKKVEYGIFPGAGLKAKPHVPKTVERNFQMIS